MTPEPSMDREIPRQREPQRQPDDPFEHGDDFVAHERLVEGTLEKANALIAAYEAGRLTPVQRAELPRVAMRLRQMLAVQMGSTIRSLDMQDGSYDNASVDNLLRTRLRQVRNIDTNMNRMWGTRTIRKVSSWITEDLPNWFGVKWLQLKDNTKHFLKTAGIVAAGATALTVGGYAVAGLVSGEGAWGGMRMLGRHAQIAGSSVADLFRRNPAGAGPGPVA